MASSLALFPTFDASTALFTVSIVESYVRLSTG